MKRIADNKTVILGMAQRGELKVGEVVYSEVNRCAYKIVATTNHQGDWIGVEEVDNVSQSV